MLELDALLADAKDSGNRDSSVKMGKRSKKNDLQVVKEQ